MKTCFQVGLIIGRGGETIKGLQAKSGARIQVVDITSHDLYTIPIKYQYDWLKQPCFLQLIPQHLPEGDGSKERTVRVTGDKRQVEMAREMIMDVMNQVCFHSTFFSYVEYDANSL